MKNFVALIMAIVLGLSQYVAAAQSAGDLFDLRNDSGLTVIVSSACFVGNEIEQMFGAGIATYQDSTQPYSTTFTISKDVILDSINLSAIAGRTTVNGPLIRGITHVKLEALSGGWYVTLLDTDVTLADYGAGDTSVLAYFTLDKLYTISTPIETNQFRITYEGGYGWGPRVDELDGFGTLASTPVSITAAVVYDFEQGLDGWTKSNDSSAISAQDGQMIMQFADYSQWKPGIKSSAISLNADENKYFALKVKAYKIPVEGIDAKFLYWNSNGYGVSMFHIVPGEQTIRFQPAVEHSEGQLWTGTITSIGFDIPDAAGTSYQQMANAEIQIDWIALSNSPDFIPTEEDDGQYIILNLYEHRTDQESITNIINAMPNNQKSNRKVGIGNFLSPFDSVKKQATEKQRLLDVLNLVTANNIPVVFAMDTEHFWEGRPEMWNWFNPGMAGYDPCNIENVEWAGWSPEDATKISWVNWGNQLRLAPTVNLLAPRVKALQRELYADFVPTIVSWWHNLPQDKKYLFAGFKVGWETGGSLLFSYYVNGNYYYETWPNDPSHDPTSGATEWLGYNALKTAGIKTSGTITEEDIATVTGRYLEYLAQLCQEFGLPRNKIFTHSWPFSTAAANELAGVNNYSCPGWSRYSASQTGLADYPELKNAMESSTASFWSLSETNFQGIPTVENWQGYLDGFLDPRCKFVMIYNYWYETPNPEAEGAIRNIINQVTGPQFCIQDAIDSAINGDTIAIPRGVYNENLNFGGKSLKLVSEDSNDWDVVKDTVINANSNGSAINASFVGSVGVEIKGLTIIGGYAENGGSINAEGTKLTVEKCVLRDSSANTYGGAIYLKNSFGSSLENVLISKCDAYFGGAIYAYRTDLKIANSTIADNTCSYKGAAIRMLTSGTLDISNSIFWGNYSSGGKITVKDSVVNVNYTNIEGGQQAFYMETGGVLNYGMGNFDVDPDFADANDYLLNSQAGINPFYAIGFIGVNSTSRCIDRANPSVGLGGEFLNADNKRRDLGAYGGTAKASLTPEGFSAVSDVNNDGVVNMVDFSILAENWLDTSGLSFGDLNRDGEISLSDLLILSQEWLTDLNK